MDWVEEICPVKGIEVVVVKVNLMDRTLKVDLIGADKLLVAVGALGKQEMHGVHVPIHLTPLIQEQLRVLVGMDC